MLLNTGTKAVQSKQGLLTTVGYKIGKEPAVYALEGSIAITGALVQWLRDNLGLINTSADVEKLAATVEDNGGVYFVPAFSGLFAPYWKNDARGVIAGLTRYVNKGHIARATLEATAWQTREVLDAMNADSGVALTALKVDGGMVYNELLMQFQSDVLNVPGHPAEGRRDDGPRGRLCRRPGGRLLGRGGRPSGELGQGQGVDAVDGRRDSRARLQALEEGRDADLRLGRVRGP